MCPLFLIKLQVMVYDASQNPLEIPGGDHQTASTAVLTIKIIDINDHAPVIQETGDLILPENKEPGFFVGQLTATDLDEGLNGEVTFNIVPDDPRALFNGPQLTQTIGFRMTPNGSIFSSRQFDREAQVSRLYLLFENSRKSSRHFEVLHSLTIFFIFGR